MKIVLITLVLFIIIFQTWSLDDECHKLGILVYEDLGCTPVQKGKDKCPRKYKCSDFSNQNKSCIFKSTDYEDNESINDDLIYPACYINCICQKKQKFACATLDCPEWLGYTPSPGCHLKYDADKCCSVGEACPPFETTCEVNGKTYKEGQRFYPSNTCKVCICGKNFNGTFEEPFCRTETCATEIDHSQEIAQYCAPAYLHTTNNNNNNNTTSSALCCPNIWVCHEDQDEIIKINTSVDQNSKLKCKFGKKDVKLGFGVEKTVSRYGASYNFSCQCQVPPFLTCLRKN